MSYKRARTGTGNRQGATKVRRTHAYVAPRGRILPMLTPGVERIGGYYGRYTGPNAELKFLDTNLTATLDATGELLGAPTGINLVPQGDTESERIGRKIVIKKINMRGWLRSVATGNSNVVRLALIQDKQANGAYPAYTDVMESAVFTSFSNLSNSGRFKVLKIIECELEPQAGVAGAYGLAVKVIKANLKCEIPIEFDNSLTTGAITTVRSNNIFWMGVSAIGDDEITFDFTTRIRYSDH